MPSLPKERDDDARGCDPGAGTIKPEHGGQIGNPPFIATEEQRIEVKALAEFLPAADIAEFIGISRATLDKHFAIELKFGRMRAKIDIAGKLISQARAGNLGAQIFYLKTQGGWNSKLELTGRGGGPIRTLDLSGFLEGKTEDELATIEGLLEQLIAAGGVEVAGDADGSSGPDEGEATGA